jgi:flagellar biosynthesis/type III secretory pathway chaperone
MEKNNLKKRFMVVLEQGLQLYRQLAILLGQERDTLLQRKAADLMEVTIKKNELLEEINNNESQRNHIVIAIAAHFGISVSDVKLSRLCKEWPDKALSQMHQEFNDVVAKVIELQKLNMKLIHQGQDFIQECMQILHFNPSQTLYGPQGNIKDPARLPSHLDNQI